MFTLEGWLCLLTWSCSPCPSPGTWGLKRTRAFKHVNSVPSSPSWDTVSTVSQSSWTQLELQLGLFSSILWQSSNPGSCASDKIRSWDQECWSSFFWLWLFSCWNDGMSLAHLKFIKSSYKTANMKYKDKSWIISKLPLLQIPAYYQLLNCCYC